ncbi:L-alanine-DL-glutamate epimerase-like enolase superfamily enzyme [Solirubrobacter pauli]|uniref:Dipeptide epimerase n=1 Tax=Solirubrobacter pauli TaxID=166793 RepID=A0A660L4I0_9ACTN|nr:dipeptide epimerase [Solirubrobacter pauli]RKQ88114.1 L-alanine-DL-glutamate epimerase-like enolase superfamily enzyme [Solirubrobacter pauli]
MRASPHVLFLRETFQIARGAADEETVVVAELDHDGIVARGEGAPVDYWGETPETMIAAIEADGAALLGDDLFAGEAIARRIAAWDGPQGAKMALDGLVHDWVGKRVRQPVWRLLGAERVTPPTSYTIGIDSVEGTADRTRRATGYEVLKIKVGGPGDLERLRAVRAVTSARLRIDGNEGWDLETARSLTPELVALGVEFVEQPFPAEDIDSFLAYREVPDRLPVLIDEGCKDLASVARIATYADGIVIKLSKCGGIREALRMIHAARALGLQVMLGCMIESELGIAQAAQLGSLVDYVDLDGHLLISSRPFTGLGLLDGRLVLSDQPGLGVERADG